MVVGKTKLVLRYGALSPSYLRARAKPVVPPGKGKDSIMGSFYGLLRFARL